VEDRGFAAPGEAGREKPPERTQKPAAAAKRKAKTVWSATKGAEYPHCRIEKVLIVTKRMMRDVA
jgi:hypothetical protein